MGVLEFFRDTLSGVYYYIYVATNLIFIFAIIGYIGEKKEKEDLISEDNRINTQLDSNN